MKTNNINGSLSHSGINVSYSFGGDQFFVNASKTSGERITSVVVYYDKAGSRTTQVSDFSAPFDEAFYSALDAAILAAAGAIYNDEDTTTASE